jgi:soluble P-type ATPase
MSQNRDQARRAESETRRQGAGQDGQTHSSAQHLVCSVRMTIKQLQDVYAPVVVSSGAMSGRDERLELCLRVSAGSIMAGANAA